MLLLFNSGAGAGADAGTPQAVPVVLSDSRGRIRVFQGIQGADGRVLVHTDVLSEVRTQSIILPDARPFADAITEFEDLINSSASREADFQSFMERQPSFLLGSDYEELYPHVVLARDGDDDLIPDFLLKPIEGMSHEPAIVDLKTADLKLIKPTPRREGLYANVMDGVNQLRTYGAYFAERENRDYVKDALGFTAYRPRLVLVAGRSPTSVPPDVRARVFDDIQPVELVTYVDLLLRIKKRAASESSVPEAPADEQAEP